MKIALLTDGITPYVIGGMQKHSFYLVKYFARNGIFVDLYHTNKSEYDIASLEFFDENEKQYIRSFIIDFPALGRLPGHYLRESYLYSERIFEEFKKYSSDSDFIYVKGFAGWKLIKEKKGGFVCAPVGINFHGYEMFQKPPDLKSYFEQKILLQKPVSYLVQNADFLFSYGGGITEIIKALNISSDKIIESPSGIEIDWINVNEPLNNQPLRFVFAGRFERRKGVEELNKVIQQLINSFEFIFDFIGPIPKAKQLKSQKIRYNGSISNSDKIKEIFRSSDVLVCPSHSEGMPNVILEGMSSGLAIIASDVGAVSQLVSSKNGILIKAGDTLSLKSAMEALLTLKKDQLEAMKVESVNRIKNQFLWEHIIKDLISEIKKRI